jgi:predicted nucleic acid-binding protein
MPTHHHRIQVTEDRELPLVLDTSAWTRVGHPDVRGLWREALFADRLRISPITRMEFRSALATATSSTNSSKSSRPCGPHR